MDRLSGTHVQAQKLDANHRTQTENRRGLHECPDNYSEIGPSEIQVLSSIV